MENTTAIVSEQTSSFEQFSYPFLVGLFSVLAVLTNTVGQKLFTLGSITLPVSAFWFPLTFLMTDVVSEVYGDKKAYFMVIMGFSMNILMLFLISLGLSVPSSNLYMLDREYTLVFSPSARLFCASMIAFLVAQALDVYIFNRLRKWTKGRYLWIRNNGSTLISQLVDTLLVNFIFLYGNTLIFKGNLRDIIELVIQLYLVKVILALLDTPLCYFFVYYFKNKKKGANP